MRIVDYDKPVSTASICGVIALGIAAGFVVLVVRIADLTGKIVMGAGVLVTLMVAVSLFVSAWMFASGRRTKADLRRAVHNDEAS